MNIEIIFDPVCPWCFIGKRRLEKALDQRPHVVANIIWTPFLLNPEIPPDGIDRTAYLIRKFGSEARVRRIYGAIANAGQSVEIEFQFDQIDRTPNSINAHRLVRFAARHDRADDTVETLFREYFILGQNTGELDVLLRIGRDLGLDGAGLGAYLKSDEDVLLINEQNIRTHRMGINGVPAFVFGTNMIISGAQEPRILERMLDAAQVSVGAA